MEIKNDLWCADAGRYGAECFYTLTDGELSLDKFEWDRLRAGQICTATSEPGRGYADLKQALLKLCADTSRCTTEQVKELAHFDAKITRALSGAGKRLSP